ncbi:hypothetical protein EST38_g6166 [Candolleomyces aberdarensis]|uniref:F-box domain-containing protein n=1 Tax=Candolleomyces aberdarensis TaxID=2316362 RepID=A0A4Q2DLP1_9AGAR|nr:hypothetical protein EST38_g6166 [Candolleomyces aberdarensis]
MASSSPFHPHLKTNYIPSDAEIPEIRTFISTRQAVLDDIDQRIKDLELQPEELEGRRRAELELISDHLALLSPIKRVPDDIISSILVTAVEERTRSSQGLASFRKAMTFSHVSKRWRAVSIGTKPLWQYLDIRIPKYPPYENDWRAQLGKLESMVRTSITRSGGYPLCIEVEGCIDVYAVSTWNSALERGCMREELRYLEGLVEILLASTARWKEVLFRFTLPFVDTPLRRLMLVQPSENAILWKVELEVHLALSYSMPEMSLDPLELWQSDWMHGGPSILMHDSIRMLNLNCLMQDITNMAVNWPSLTHLEFRGYHDIIAPSLHFGPNEALRLLKLCRSLVTCSIPMESTPPIVTTEPIMVAFLEELSITPLSSDIPTNFASLVILPSLRKLAINEGSSPDCIPHDHWESGVAQFVERFGDQLTDVKLHTPTFTPTGLDHCLRHLTNVVRLELHSNPPRGYYNNLSDAATLNPEMFARITPVYESRSGRHLVEVPVLPKLEVVAFRCEYRYHWDEPVLDALIDFVAARRREGGEPGIACLRRAEFVASVPILLRDPLQLLRAKDVNLDGFSFEGYEVYLDE